jgi:ABC-2 type transport system ATP-binding protein
VLQASGLTKHFGPLVAVDDLSFQALPGTVTGFLGPNGAGKTTTLRMLLGLVHPTAGTATIDGRAYADLADPVRTVGAALESSSVHPGRSGADHLRGMCLAAGLPTSRAADALAQVGLAQDGDRRAGTYSLGMRQRLMLAGALLGDPQVLVLDEPANGLDPEGIAWLRGFLRHLAGLGRTVLVSSHVLAEVEQTVDDVVILARGRLVRACPLAQLVADRGGRVVVRSPEVDRLAAALAGVEGPAVTSVSRSGPDGLVVEGVGASVVGRTALHAGVELHELREEQTDLEAVFLALTADAAPDIAGNPA